MTNCLYAKPVVSRRDRPVTGSSKSRMAKLLNAQQERPLGLGQAPPNAVRLTGSQRVLSALGHHRAVVTDLFCVLNPTSTVLSAFFQRVKEDLHVHPTAGGEQLPVPFLADRWRQTPIDVQRALPYMVRSRVADRMSENGRSRISPPIARQGCCERMVRASHPDAASRRRLLPLGSGRRPLPLRLEWTTWPRARS